MPGQVAPHEVNENEAEALKVVPARLLLAQVGVETGVPGRPRQALVVAKRDVLVRPRVLVPLRQAEVNDMDIVLAAADADQVVVRLDVAVQEPARVDVFDPLDELVGKHEHSVEGELAVAVVEEVLEAGAQQVHDERRVVTFLAHPENLRCTQAILQQLVELGLVQDLRVLRLDLLHLDGNLLLRVLIHAQKHLSKSSAS